LLKCLRADVEIGWQGSLKFNQRITDEANWFWFFFGFDRLGL